MRIVLTDGIEVFETKEIQDSLQLIDENIIAGEATDGNLFWVTEKDYRKILSS